MGYDKYDVFIKMLEIIEIDSTQSYDVPEEKKTVIFNSIERIEGNFKMEIGDRFENINQSIISTRSAIAKGIINVRKVEGAEIANAIEKLEKEIAEAKMTEMNDENKNDALNLLNELTRQASSPNKVKAVLKSIGNSLWETIKNVDSISKTATLLWPIISKLWI